MVPVLLHQLLHDVAAGQVGLAVGAIRHFGVTDGSGILRIEPVSWRQSGPCFHSCVRQFQGRRISSGPWLAIRHSWSDGWPRPHGRIPLAS